MVIIHKNVIEDYWNDDSIFCTSGISDIMTYSQFFYIYKYIFFTNKFFKNIIDINKKK